MEKSSSFWALLFLVSHVIAGPIQQSSCSTECRSPTLDRKFRYAVGQTYTYSFLAKTKTWMMGTSDDQALLEIKGQALVIFRAPCDAVLQLRQITISGNLDEKVDASELEKRMLSFSWQDGTVESLCPEKDEPVWVVNIKRSVISMLQHTAQSIEVAQSHVLESDVIGRCLTEYAVEGTGRVIKVIRTKIPNQCTNHVDTRTSIPTVAYHIPAKTQTIPLMNSTSVCKQHIKDNVIHSVECHESHRFRPLSTEKGGARTDVTSSISLISTTRAVGIKLSSNRVPKSLILDPRGSQSGFKNVNSVVFAICQELAADSPVHVSRLFTELVHSFRKASPNEVMAAWNNLSGRKICPEAAKTEKLFLDALPQAGSTGAITVMVKILKENKLSNRQALGWYLSLPLSKFANIDSIKAVLPLVDDVSNSRVALLGLTGLVRRYCVDNMEECQSNADVLQFSTKLANMLGNQCHVDKQSEIKVFSVLKALGNLAVMTTEVHAKVSECTKQISLPATIRLAAIEATRSTPCNSQAKMNLLSILEDRKEDSEIRIAAYQGVMRCPCSASVDRIQEVLNKEETNQVGGYITSHLKNIKSNPTPGKNNVRNLIKKLNLEKKSFPRDLRKYSSNLVFSNFYPNSNTGWEVDSSIVYSPKSFFPRSASMNLSLDLFGQSVNLFEFGVRGENMERSMQNIFQFLEQTTRNLYSTGTDVWESLNHNRRSKRSNLMYEEFPNFEKLVNLDYETENSGLLNFDAYLRVFGSEISTFNFNENDEPSDLENSIVNALRDLVKGARRADIDVARSLMFLDSTVTFPTIAGFPLRLAINGTSTIGLGLESQTDLSGMFSHPLNAKIKLKFNPLAVTEISASMTVDITVAKTGIKMASTVHSSMSVDFSAQYKEGKGAEIKVDLPKSKMTLIDFKSSVMLVHQTADNSERNQPVKIVNEATYSRGGCFEHFSSITGMRLCATSSVSIPRPNSVISADPTPDFPLSGSTSFSVVLEKTEPSMTGYLFSISTTQEQPMSSSFLMQLNTPGSITNREISVRGILTLAPLIGIKINAQTPWGKFSTETELVSRPDIQWAMMKIIIEDQYEFYAKLQMKLNQGDHNYSVATTLEAGWPQQPPVVLMEGTIIHDIGRSYHVSLKPSGPFAGLPFGFQVTLGSEFNRNVQKIWLNDLQLLTPIGSAHLSTEIGRQDGNCIALFDMKYGNERKMHNIFVKGQFQSFSEDRLFWKHVFVHKSTHFPDLNFVMTWDAKGLDGVLTNVFILAHGPEFQHMTNRFYLSNSIHLKRKPFTMDSDYIIKTEVTYPLYGINFKTEQSLILDDRRAKGYPNSPKYYEANFTTNIQLHNAKIFDTKLDLAFAHPEFLYDLSAKMTYPGRIITLVDTGKWIDHSTFSMSPVLEFHPGRRIEMIGKVSVIPDRNGMSVNVNLEADVNELDEKDLYSLAINGKLDSRFMNGDHSLGIEVQVPDMEKIFVNILLSNMDDDTTISNRLQVESQLTGYLYQMSLSYIVDIDFRTSTVNVSNELLVKSNHMDGINWKIVRKRTTNLDYSGDNINILLIAPNGGENTEIFFFMENFRDSFRMNSKYENGPIQVTLDSAGKLTSQNGKVDVDGFIELKAPIFGILQSKVALVSSVDITSILENYINGQLTWDFQHSRMFTLDTKTKISSSSADFSLILETPTDNSRHGLTMGLRLDPTNPRSEGSLVIFWPYNTLSHEIRIDAQLERRPDGHYRFKLTTATPFPMFETNELSFDYRYMERYTHEFFIVVGLLETKTELNGRVSLRSHEPEIDLTLTLPSIKPIRFVTRALHLPGDYTGEIRTDWGTRTLLGLQGSYKFIARGEREVFWKIHSPELGLDHYEIKIVKRWGPNDQNKPIVELTVRRESTTLINFELVNKVELEYYSTKLNGKATFSLPEMQINDAFVKYSLEQRRVEEDGEYGREYGRLRTLDVDFSIVDFPLSKLSGHTRWTNKEKSSSISTCYSSGACHEQSLGYKISAIPYYEDRKVLKEAFILSKTNSSKGVQNLKGFRFKYMKQVAYSVYVNIEHSVEVIFNEAKNRKFGYKLNRKWGEFDFEVFTPGRILAVAFEKPNPKHPGNPPPNIFSIWLDKIREPDNKLVIISSVDYFHEFDGMDGVMSSVTIKHPNFPRNLEYKAEYHQSYRRGIYHFKLDADVLDNRHERWILETLYTRDYEEALQNEDYTEEDRQIQPVLRNNTIEMSLRNNGGNVAVFLTLYGLFPTYFDPNTFTFGGILKTNVDNRIQELFADFKKDGQQVSLTFGSPSKQSTLDGRISFNNDQLQLDASSNFSGLLPTYYIVNLNTAPHIDIRVSSNTSYENYHHFAGGLLDDNRFELSLFRQLNLQKKEMAAINLNLNRTNVLSTRLTWKLEHLRGLLTSVRSQSQFIAMEMENTFSSMAVEFGNILPELGTLVDLFIPIYENLGADFSNQFEQIKTEIWIALMNEYADILEVLANGVFYFAVALDVVFEQLAILDPLISDIGRLLNAIDVYLYHLFEPVGEVLSEMWYNLSYEMISLKYMLQWRWEEISQNINEFYNDACKEVEMFFALLIRDISNFSYHLEEYYPEIGNWIDSFKFANILSNLRYAIANANMNFLRERIANFLNWLSWACWRSFLLPFDGFLTELTKTYPEITRSAYRYGKIPIRRMYYYLRKSSQMTINLFQSNGTNVSGNKNILAPWIGEFVVYDLKNGEIHYLLPLSQKISDLRDLWQSLGNLFDSSLSSIVSNSMNKYRDMLREYCPVFFWRRLNGYASLIGSSGIITFDKKSFDLSGGSCTYLLTRNFYRNNEYGIAVNFDSSSNNHPKKSIIFFHEQFQIEIRDEEVLLDNRRIPLPFLIWGHLIFRSENRIIIMNYADVLLDCDFANDVCFFNLDQKIGDRNMGLLGNFNNEQADDMIEPSGKMSKDLTSFINSWKINKSCNDKIQTTADSQLIESPVCSKLFVQEDSDLSYCFKVVSPAPYNDLCHKFAMKKKSESTFQGQLKSLIAGYETACRR